MEQTLQPKFYCVDCDYKCIYLAHWTQQLQLKKTESLMLRSTRQ